MKGKRFTDEQITYALRQAEGGTPVADTRSGHCGQWRARVDHRRSRHRVHLAGAGGLGLSERREARLHPTRKTS